MLTEQEFLTAFRQKVSDGLKLWNSPSVAIGIIKDGRVVLSEGFGQRDMENSLPANEKTLYQIGSCTKAFTAALVAVMVDQGKLDWDTPIVNYLPEFALYDSYVSARLTLRDALSHRSGLPRHEFAWYGTGFTREQLVHNMRYLEPNQPLRAKFQYNNFCYVLAGHVVERVSGKSWEACLDEYILRPLGMDLSNYYVELAENSDNHAVPYGRDPDAADPMRTMVKIPYYRNPAENMQKGIGTPLGPAGCINSCTDDMLKWVQLHLSKGEFEGKRIISEKAMQEMHKSNMLLDEPLDMPAPETQFLTYGMGWCVESFRGHKLLQHGGNINGFSGFTSFMPELNLGVVAYTNMNSSYLHFALAREVYDYYLGVESGSWVTRYHDFIAARMKLGSAVMMKVLTGEQVQGTTPSRNLEAYTGVYTRPGYEPAEITLENGELHFLFGGSNNVLQHYHYDTFVIGNSGGVLPKGGPIHFRQARVGSAIDELAIPLVTEPGGDLVRFFRQK